MAAGSVLAVATLVVLGPVLRRGPAPERVAAGVLCLLPVFGLVGMLVPLLRWGR